MRSTKMRLQIAYKQNQYQFKIKISNFSNCTYKKIKEENKNCNIFLRFFSHKQFNIKKTQNS
jgi:hypothetical protein